MEKAIASHVPTEFSEGFFADAVVLVEGQTDRVILEAIAEKFEKDLDRRGITVLSVSGKSGLSVCLAILRALGIPTYVVADGDYSTSDRKTYSNKTEEEIKAARSQAHESHKKATADIISALPKKSEVLSGALPYTFGDDSIICRDFTIWKDDVEEELTRWPTFGQALTRSGVNLAARNDKNLLAYRNAVLAADLADVPKSLTTIIQAISSLTTDLDSTQTEEEAATR
ncbi:TOPRIM nucleotidyl transferase/hydrolase domain-containing protein [Clavibacter tessellarius]|uniref:TOPRIM nucleotidyl transferase/hydrolase domain-containing protein n=1 Tax=Clavibacter tessellarius TaxID=31965 RepID=UPI00324BEF05